MDFANTTITTLVGATAAVLILQVCIQGQGGASTGNMMWCAIGVAILGAMIAILIGKCTQSFQRNLKRGRNGARKQGFQQAGWDGTAPGIEDLVAFDVPVDDTEDFEDGHYQETGLSNNWTQRVKDWYGVKSPNIDAVTTPIPAGVVAEIDDVEAESPKGDARDDYNDIVPNTAVPDDSPIASEIPSTPVSSPTNDQQVAAFTSPVAGDINEDDTSTPPESSTQTTSSSQSQLAQMFMGIR